MMTATRGFIEMVRTRLGAGPNAVLRIGQFDFVNTRRNQFVGIPDERGPAAQKEALELCSRILAAYRMSITFGEVFPTAESYTLWYLMNRRAPSGRDLSELARAKGVYVPFMGFPYKSPLLTAPLRFKVEPVRAFHPTSVVQTNRMIVNVRVPVMPLASPSKLQQLQAAFARH